LFVSITLFSVIVNLVDPPSRVSFSIVIKT
jgi:hypothetical protein